MPAPDWLEGLGGAFLGINRGATLAADPYKAWDAVVSSGLANDKSAIALRDFAALQNAREAQPDFYGNLIGAQDVGSRLASSRGERDIFGLNQELLGSRALVSPEFQAANVGLGPGDPQFRINTAAERAKYSPELGIGEYDKFGIPGLQQRNLNEQSVLIYLTEYARRTNPGAQVIRAPDGTFKVLDKDGTELHSLTADQAVKGAAFIAAKTPLDTIDNEIKLQVLVNKSNADTYKALNDGKLTPAARASMLKDQRIGWAKMYSDAASNIRAIDKDTLLTTEERDAKKQPYIEEAKVARAQLQKVVELEQAVFGSGRFPRGGAATPGAAVPGVVPQGTSQVTTPTLAEIVAQATGGGAGMGPWGMAAEGPTYPARRVSPIDTGVRPIGGLDVATEVARILQGQ